MMSSMGSTRGNPRGSGGREKSSAKTSAQTSGKSSSSGEHPAPVGKKATPDQMRLAQMISDGTNEDNTKEKIRQVQDVVPKSEDEVLVALHDSNYDTEKAINLLLERGEGDQQGEWETISSRKSKQRGVSSGFRNNSDVITNSKDNGPEKEGGGRDRRDNRGNKDRDSKDKDRDRDGHKDSGGRDRDGERERGGFGGRGRGRNNRGQLPPRMARGRGRENDSNSREREKNERNRWDGESGRGRGRRGYDHMNGPSRRGRGPRSFTNSKFGGNFEDDAFKPGDNVWTNPPAETENNTWDNSMVTEDWGAEDWSGDVDDAALNGGRTELPPTGGVGQPNWMTALTESKVFMASSTPPSTTPITLDSIESQSNAMPPPSNLTGNSSLNAPVSMSPGSSLSAGTAGLAPSSGMPQSTTMPEMSRGISLAELFAKPASAPPVNNQPLGGSAGLGSSPGMGSSNSMGGLGGTSGLGGSTGLGGSSGLGSVGGGISVGGIGTSGMGTTGIGSAGTIGTSSGIGGSMGGSTGLGNAIGSSAGMGSNSMGGGSSSIGDTLSQRQTSSSVFSAYVDLKPPQPPVSEPSKTAGQVQQLGGAPPEPPSATVPASQLTTNQQPAQQRVQSQTPSTTKPSKKKLPPPSTKIPASAVEMPGPVPARGLGVLDVQFGTMNINMEPSLPDFEVPVGSISSANVPSTSLAVTVSLSSDAYSVSEPSTTASHLSYTTKVSESSYPAAPSMNTTLMSNSTSTTTIAAGLDQTSRSVYTQNAQTRQMTPDPIPLPTQDLKGNTYMQTQKPSPTPMDTKPDKQQLSNTPGSHAPSHTTPLSALTSHPSSLASSLSSSGMSSGSMPSGSMPSSSMSTSGMSSSGMSSSASLHSQMGLSSHAPSHQSQSLGSSRQTPNSYHGPTSASIASTVHSGSSSGYGSSAPTVTHPSSAYSSVHSNLGGPSTHSSTGLSSSSLTASGLPSGPSSISALSSSSQSGLSSGGQTGLPGSVSGLTAGGAQLASTGQLTSSSQLTGGSQLSSGSQLSNSSQLSSGQQLSAGGQLSSNSQLAGSSVQLSNSGHPPSSLSGSLNSGGLSASQSSNTHSTHTSVQTSPLTQGKLGGLDNRIHQASNQHVLDHNSHQSSLGPSSLSSGTSGLSSSASHPTASSSVLTTTTASTVSSFPGSTAVSASALGFSSASTVGVTLTTTTASTGIRATTMASSSKVPNLPPGMSFVPNQQYIMGHGLPLVNAFAPHQPFYNYEEFQMQLSRMPAAATAMGYPYDLQQFQQPATTLTAARDVSSLSTAPYSVTEASKFTRGDASSPVAASSLSAQQPAQQPAQHATGSHHTQQAQQQPTLFNAAAAAATIPPGYGYAGGLPYYPAGPAGILPPGLQYPPAAAVFPAVSTVQPSNRSQPATTPHSGFQQSAYGSHGAYGTGYDDLTQTQDFKSNYSGVSQTQKTATGAAGRSSVGGTSAASATVGAADISGSSYTSKTHTPSFPDKQSFHGTPPPFNFPLASGTQAGPLNPAATAYPQHPFVPMLQHHNAATAILPPQLHGDSHAGSSQRSQGTSGPAKQTSKPSYASTYWSAN